MPINNEDFSGMFFVKDSNGNWVPVGKVADFSTTHSVCVPNPPPAEVTLTGDVMVTGEVKLSDEAAAQWWAISQGGIEIVER